MVINRHMEKVSLEEFQKIQTPSGSWKDKWEHLKYIECAIFPLSGQYLMSANVKFADSTNTGLCKDKGIKEGKHRINKDGEIYTIQFVNDIGKHSQLILKKVVADV